MKFKHIILALILVLLTTSICWAGRYILRDGDIVHFDTITRYGVDDMAGEGLVGTDTELQYDSGILYNKIETDLLLDDKADTPHAHDDRYYTETEEDTWRNSTTQTEMGYVHGVTSDIQTQLNDLSSNDSSVWGNITGTLSDQTDLQAELDLKLDIADTDSWDIASDKVMADSATWDAAAVKVNADSAIWADKYTKTEADNLLDDKLDSADSTLFIWHDGSVDFTADQSLGGFNITNSDEPTADSDLTTKYYVDQNAGGGSNYLTDDAEDTGTIINLDEIRVDTAVTDLIEANQTATPPALKYNISTSKWQYSNDGSSFNDMASGGSQNLFEEIRTDTGTTTADSTTDTLWITGGTDIGVYNSGDTIVIDYEGTGGGGAVAWGAITGTLSSQTDLEARLINMWKQDCFNAFRIGGYVRMIDGFANDFTVEDEGIDIALSDTVLYDTTGDYYYREEDNSVASPLSQWKMNDDAANTTVIDSVGSNTGSAAHNTDTMSVVGKISDALEFDTTVNDHVDCGNNATLAITSEITIMAWVKPESTGDGRTILKRMNLINWVPYNYDFYLSAGGNIIFYFYDTADRGTSSSGTVTDSVWTHIAVTYVDATDSAKFYINGSLDTDTTITGTLPATGTQSLWIGSRPYPTDCFPFSGAIDDVRIYDSELNQTEISALYNLGNGTEDENPTYSSGDNMELYTSTNVEIDLTSATVKAMILSNAEPTSVKLSRVGTGTTMTSASLVDSDIFDDTYYSYNYTADVSGETSDTCVRAEIVTDDSAIHIHSISITGFE